ncbi:hypothetical protein [Aequorivita capsosiphonis]|uniref:hypothetical protein n=1 Tax=Aequorivita capsosiphonis TaxID=487317 RepID=UPI0003F7E973|nr:hypothetical protein [Aequorivita capsosiphonis]
MVIFLSLDYADGDRFVNSGIGMSYFAYYSPRTRVPDGQVHELLFTVTVTVTEYLLNDS